MSELRIASFLPSATEMVCALGLADRLIGVTHECDYPPQIRDKPVLVRNALSLADMTPAEIDTAVAAGIHNGQSLYHVDEHLLQELAPTLILTQDLCQVCAPSGNQINQLLSSLDPKPVILWFTPRSLADIENNLRDLGKATGRAQEAETVISSGRARIQNVTALTRQVSRPRVFCLEWVDPVYCAGHWLPEMVELAGGLDSLARKGADSVRLSWEDVLHFAPERLVIAPCGFNLPDATKQALQLFTRPGWSKIPAVQQGRVYAVDANSYFARPGPRVIDGVELLAHLIHPKLCQWTGPSNAFQVMSHN